MILIERKYNDDPFWPIGSITKVDRGEWLWTSFDIDGDEFENIYSQGCATSRVDAEKWVREEWRNQLKYKKERSLKS